MPSDPSIDRALEALERPRSAFVSAVAEFVGELGRLLVHDEDPVRGRVERAVATLGEFGESRVDPRQFAAVLSDRPPLPPAAMEAVGRARAILSGIVTAGPDAFLVEVARGEDVSAAAAAALARLGRVFGAARVAALARSGAYRSGEHSALLEGLPFARWNDRERALAPPLLVRVEGARLHAAGLADLLDGAVRVGIFAPGVETPAPLALLVTPGVFVGQGSSVEVLERLFDGPGPGAAAVLGAGAARFVHEPARGPGLADRLTVEALPDGGASSRALRDFRVAEERSHLDLLMRAAAAEAHHGATDGRSTDPGDLHADPAGLLAAWLLRQAGLPEPAGAAGP